MTDAAKSSRRTRDADHSRAEADRGESEEGRREKSERRRSPVGCKFLAAADRHQRNPDRRERNRRYERSCRRIIERNEAEERNLSGFRLSIGDRDDEALGAHRRQHERGGDHLRHRAEQCPDEIDRGQPRQVEASPDEDARKETSPRTASRTENAPARRPPPRARRSGRAASHCAASARSMREA